MKLTLVLTLLTVSSSYSQYFGHRGLEDENSVSNEPEPSIDFTADWEENLHGELGVGGDFKIHYDGSRLPGRPTMYGQPSWNIFVEYKFNDGPEFKSESLGNAEMIDGKEIFTKTISIPVNASKVVMWFRHWSYYGGSKYDSNHGSNYEFQITVPSIVFEADWNEIVHGELVSGGHFDLFYNSKRLAVGATIVAQMKFADDGEVVDKYLQKDDSIYQTSVVSIPDEAERLEMWFYYEDKDGEKQYDSNYGQNYNFNLSE